MKRKLGYLFIAICITLLVLYLFRYKRALIIAGKVPSAATEIAHIDLRQIEHQLLIDAIKNPLRYISFKAKKEGVVSVRKTITIPSNLFFFTNNSNLKDAWFSSFIKIKDSSKLSRYLVQKGFKESIDEGLALYKKDKFVIGISNNRLIIVYKNQQDQSILTTIQAVFKETKFYERDADLLESISNSESDISYASVQGDFLEADFKNGLFEMKGKVYSDLFISDTHTEHPENSIGFIAAKINKEHAVFKSILYDKYKTKFDDFTKLSMDSIVSEWNGSTVLNLRAIEKKTDTIVTYEYDDDFNKMEKKSVQELIIPDVTLDLGGQASLYEYFYNNKAIQIIENDTLFTTVPLYKMYAIASINRFQVSTENQFQQTSIKEDKCKLHVYFNSEKYLQNPLEFSLLPANNKYLQLLDNTTINLSEKDELSVKVELKNSERNFIGQFIKP